MTEPGEAARTRVESTFNSIRRDIVAGTFPPGSRLGVERLRAVYGVGSSTVREALSLLVADALVESEGQKGFTVSPMSLEDLTDLSKVRVLLEAYALQESIANGDDDWEAEIVAAFHRLGKAQQRLDNHEPDADAEWELRNREFHDALNARCDSRWVSHMLTMLNHHSERYRHAALVDESIPRDVHSEHRALMEAALAGDTDTASKVLADHIGRTTDVISALLSAEERSA